MPQVQDASGALGAFSPHQRSDCRAGLPPTLSALLPLTHFSLDDYPVVRCRLTNILQLTADEDHGDDESRSN